MIATEIPTRNCPLEVLLVEDEADIAEPIAECLSEEGYNVHVASDGKSGLESLSAKHYDLMISDIRLPEMDGLSLFDWTRENAPNTAVILMSAYGSVSEAVNALRHNAVHYLRKPFAIDELLTTVEEVAERTLAQRLANEGVSPETDKAIAKAILGNTPSMVALKHRLSAIARSDAPVLIHGETGTGKEVAARAIHNASKRKDGPFVAINCGALPETLIESELFGHERGAFTGAVQRRLGKFVEADGGTLFLDEVTEMSPACQVKLLRVLQEGVVQPLGGTGTTAVNARVLAATNTDVRDLVGNDHFRQDLLYRLKVLDIRLPPLRDRRADIPLLVEHFLQKFGLSLRDPSTVSPFAWALLREYPFPGNVRELEHAIHHAVVLSDGGTIDACHLPEEIRGSSDARSAERRATLSEATAAFERQFIIRTLDELDWSKKRVAARLGISRKNLWEKIRRYGIVRQPA